MLRACKSCQEQQEAAEHADRRVMCAEEGCDLGNVVGSNSFLPLPPMEAPIFWPFCVIDVWVSCRNKVILKNLEVNEIVYMKSPTYINRKGERSSSSKHQTTKVTKKKPYSEDVQNVPNRLFSVFTWAEVALLNPCLKKQAEAYQERVVSHIVTLGSC